MTLLAELLKKITGTISVQEARTLLEQGALLVDVRSPQEYASGHAKNAVNYPLNTLSESIKKLSNKSLIIHCQSGVRSRMAVRQLKRAGLTSVYNLGGLQKAFQL